MCILHFDIFIYSSVCSLNYYIQRQNHFWRSFLGLYKHAIVQENKIPLFCFLRLQTKSQRKGRSLCELKSFMCYQPYLWNSVMNKCKMHKGEKLKRKVQRQCLFFFSPFLNSAICQLVRIKQAIFMGAYNIFLITLFPSKSKAFLKASPP